MAGKWVKAAFQPFCVMREKGIKKDCLLKDNLSKSGRRDSNPRPSAWKANALSTELLPQIKWAKMDSNHRRRKPADLQSAPFGHSGTCPTEFQKRAEDGTQTRDPQLGRLMLYQLSYFRKSSGQRWIRTTEGVSQQIYSLPHLATLVFARPQSRI